MDFEFTCTGTPEGMLQFHPVARKQFKKYLADNGPMRVKLVLDVPESNRLRGWFEGALVTLVCFYQEGMDHHSPADRRQVREWLKAEFNGDMVAVRGTVLKIARSTKGRAVLAPFCERVKDWLFENYQPPAEALDPERYKTWRDTVFPYGGPDNYLDYLVECGILKTQSTQ